MKPFLIRASLFILFCICSLPAKHIIFDLGDVLVTQNKFSFAREIGLSRFFMYALLDQQNPKYLKNIVFDVLNELGIQEPIDGLTANHEQKPLPGVMCQWLAGTLSPFDLIKQATEKIDELARTGYFVSLREQQLVTSIITNMFTPQILVDNTYAPRGGIKLVAELASMPEHDLYILSNWDAISFDLLTSNLPTKALLNSFKPENIFISGRYGVIKPHKAIYELFLATYDLDAAECIFIDDQADNIKGAQACGITAIQFYGNYGVLRRQLSKMLG